MSGLSWSFLQQPPSIVLLQTTAKERLFLNRDSRKLEHFRVIREYIVTILFKNQIQVKLLAEENMFNTTHIYITFAR
jgi:hypothetical protein